MIIIMVIVIGIFVGLSFLGKKLQKKQEATETQAREGAKAVSIFVIEKKRVRMRDAGFPQIVIDQTPKFFRRSKVSVVRAKVGPQVAILMCDEKAYPLIPEKKEVKVLLNGIYIVEAKSARGGLLPPPAKKGFMAKLREKAAGGQEEMAAREAAKKAKKAAKQKEKDAAKSGNDKKGSKGGAAGNLADSSKKK